MSEKRNTCVIPIANVDGRKMTVLRKLRNQGGVPLGFDADVSTRSVDIALWLNSMGAVGVEGDQVQILVYKTSIEAAQLVRELNDKGHYYPTKLESALTMTSWRRVNISVSDFDNLKKQSGNLGLPLADVRGELWENSDTDIGVPLALIWELIYDSSHNSLKEIRR